MTVRHPSEFRKGDKVQSPIERPTSHTHGKDAEEYKGLCINCANRKNCVFPKPEGGVWHCEEYTEDS